MQQSRAAFVYPSAKFKTFGKDDTLPRLPVPKLEDTVARYLQSVRPHVDDKAFEKTRALAERFQATDGAKLHQMLLERAKTEINWVAKYWDMYAYLSLREPLIPYYSMGGSCRREDMPWPPHSTKIQQAALYTYVMLEFWQLLRDERVVGHRSVDGKIFTMAQFRNLFNTCRRPGVGLDQIVSHFRTDAACPSHFIVMSRGRIFSIDALSGHSGLLTPPELEVLFEQIEAKTTIPGEGVAALTCDNRDQWAKNHSWLESLSEHNKEAVKIIESAIVIVVLEDCAPKDEGAGMRYALGGNLANHWVDKSLALAFFTNGTVSSLCDHAAYDGMVSISAFHYVVTGMEEMQGVWQGERRVLQTLAPAQEIIFDLDSTLRQRISALATEAEAVANPVCAVRDAYWGYGKKFIQSQKQHPDPWVQIALQLAYYKLHKKFAPMYETATTRQFRDARTETVRSCTIEVADFIKELVGSPSNLGKCRELLLKAIAKHNQLMSDARNAQGCDRHMFGMQCLAFENNIPMPEIFQDPSWKLSGGSGNFVLSTSLLGYNPHGGCVAPMCLDGYGCFYNILPDKIVVAISSWRRSTETSAEKLYASFCNALDQMQRVMLSAKI